MYRDKQLVRITLFVLLVGIVLVYAVFFNIHGESLSIGAAHTLQQRRDNAQHDDAPEATSGDIAQVTGMQQQTGEIVADETTGTALVFS